MRPPLDLLAPGGCGEASCIAVFSMRRVRELLLEGCLAIWGAIGGDDSCRRAAWLGFLLLHRFACSFMAESSSCSWRLSSEYIRGLCWVTERLGVNNWDGARGSEDEALRGGPGASSESAVRAGEVGSIANAR